MQEMMLLWRPCSGLVFAIKTLQPHHPRNKREVNFFKSCSAGTVVFLENLYNTLHVYYSTEISSDMG